MPTRWHDRKALHASKPAPTHTLSSDNARTCMRARTAHARRWKRWGIFWSWKTLLAWRGCWHLCLAEGKGLYGGDVMQGRGGGSGGKAQRRRLVLARVRQNTQGRRSRLVVPPSTSRLATRTRRCGKIRGKCVDVAGRSGVNASSPSIIVLRIILGQNTVKGEYGIACTGPFAFQQWSNSRCFDGAGHPRQQMR